MARANNDLIFSELFQVGGNTLCKLALGHITRGWLKHAAQLSKIIAIQGNHRLLGGHFRSPPLCFGEQTVIISGLKFIRIPQGSLRSELKDWRMGLLFWLGIALPFKLYDIANSWLPFKYARRSRNGGSICRQLPKISTDRESPRLLYLFEHSSLRVNSKWYGVRLNANITAQWNARELVQKVLLYNNVD